MASRSWYIGAVALLTAGLTAVGAGGGRATAATDGGNGRIALVDTVRGNTDIYTVRPDGTGLRRLTTGSGFDTDPSYSADGRSIAFVRARKGSTRVTELWTMNTDGSGQQRLLTEADGIACPDFSPDGRRLAFNRTGALRSSRQGIWILTLAHHTERRLAPPSPGFESCPTWSPDGRFLAFSRSLGGDVDGPRIWTMRADGSQRRQLTRHARRTQESDETPDWSPDGRYLLFTRDVDRTTESWSNLWKIRADGTGLQQLTRTDAPGGFTGAAVFSPDGTRIAGVCKNPMGSPDDRRTTGVFTLRADGSGQRAILASPNARVSSWQPLPLGG